MSKRFNEPLDLPRRYAVRFSDGAVHEMHADSKSDAERGQPSARAHLMGTHETLAQARARLGI